MTNLMQDVTITLNLSEMTPTKYKETMAMLKQLSQNLPNTYTYTDEMGLEFDLTEEHKTLFKSYST